MKINFKMKKSYEELEAENKRLLAIEEERLEIRKALGHDLITPTAYLITASDSLEEQINTLHNSRKEVERNNAHYLAMQTIRGIQSAARKASKLPKLLSLSELTYEEAQKNASYFNPSDEINSIIESQQHRLIKSSLGLNFNFSHELKSKKIWMNQGVFSSILDNLIANAIQYTIPESVIKLFCYETKENFNIELENALKEKINAQIINKLFKKGYRVDRDKKDPNRQNEGFGLYFIEKLVKELYSGNIEVSSEDKFKITETKTKNTENKQYGVIYPPCYTPLPSFHAKVSIPLELLIIPKKEPEQTIEEIINKLDNF